MSENSQAPQEAQEIETKRPKRAELTAEESFRRMETLPERKEQLIAAIRDSKVEGRKEAI